MGILPWKELQDLHAAIGENDAALQRLTLDLAGRDAEAQAKAGQGEAAIAERHAVLQRLREQVDAAPAARGKRLENLHAEIHAAAAKVESMRKEIAQRQKAASAADRIAWEGAEERAAALAAECARENAAADAAEAERLKKLGELVEALARQEEAQFRSV